MGPFLTLSHPQSSTKHAQGHTCQKLRWAHVVEAPACPASQTLPQASPYCNVNPGSLQKLPWDLRVRATQPPHTAIYSIWLNSCPNNTTMSFRESLKTFVPVHSPASFTWPLPFTLWDGGSLRCFHFQFSWDSKADGALAPDLSLPLSLPSPGSNLPASFGSEAARRGFQPLLLWEKKKIPTACLIRIFTHTHASLKLSTVLSPPPSSSLGSSPEQDMGSVTHGDTVLSSAGCPDWCAQPVTRTMLWVRCPHNDVNREHRTQHCSIFL